MSRHPNEWLRRQIRLTELPVRAHSGSYYPCEQQDIDDYQSYPSIWRGFYYNGDDVLLQMTKWLVSKPSTRELAAFDRLAEALIDPGWGPDIIIKALHDIDTALFGGKLRRKVVVRWTSQEGFTRMRVPHAIGATDDQGRGHSLMWLNTSLVFRLDHDPKMEMWQTMIHEALVS